MHNKYKNDLNYANLKNKKAKHKEKTYLFI